MKSDRPILLSSLVSKWFGGTLLSVPIGYGGQYPMRIGLIGAVTLLASSQAAATPVPDRRWPTEVRSAHQRNLLTCQERRGYLFIQGSKYVVSGDFNKDGHPDYLVDSNWLECSNAVSLYCGSLGCNVDLLLSLPSGQLQSDESFLAREVEIVRSADRDYVRILGREGPAYWGWNGREFAPISAIEHQTDTSTRQPSSGLSAEASAYLLAMLDWRTCLEEQAHRIALRAVDARASIPGAATVFQICAAKEQAIDRTRSDTASPHQSPTDRRARETDSVTRMLEDTFRQNNYD